MRNNKKIIKKYRKKVVATCIILILLWCFCIYLYISYQKIQIKTYDTVKSAASYEQTTVENVETNSKNICDVVEKVSNCVVGISKFKDNKDYIFSDSIENEMGLRYRCYCK